MEPHKNEEPPLLDVKVTNPLTYIKRWWKRIVGNEGMEFRLRVRPLTAIAIAIIVSSMAFGVGRFVLPVSLPFFKYTEQPTLPDGGLTFPTPDPWRETAFTGNVQFSPQTNRYYLITTSSEAITLEVPSSIDLKSLINKRIFAAGNYNKSTRILVVDSASDLELLPKKPSPIPTTPPSPTPTPSPTTEPEIEATTTPQPTSL